MFIAMLFITDNGGKNPSVHQLMKGMCYYLHSSTKRNEIRIHTTTSMNLRTTLLKERNQSLKPIYHIITLICGISRRTKSIWTRHINGWLGLEGEGWRGLSDNENRVSSWGDKNVLKLYCGDRCKTLNIS